MPYTNEDSLAIEGGWMSNVNNENIVNETTHMEVSNTKSANRLLDELMNQSGDELYKFCRRLTYSKEDADDLFQETFLRILEQTDKLKDVDNPAGRLFSTAIYTWKEWQRKVARRNRIAPIKIFVEAEVNHNSRVEEEIILAEESRMVREIVSELPEKFRIPIVLYYSIEMNTAEIASVLQLPVGTVKSRLHKGRKMVEKGLVKKGYEI